MSDIDLDESFEDELDDNINDEDDDLLDDEVDNNLDEEDDDDENNILNSSSIITKKNTYEDIIRIENELSSPKISHNKITKYEITKVIGLRAQQIASGMPVLVETSSSNVIDIALKEYYQNKSPFIIKRPITDTKFEYWRLEDLEKYQNLSYNA